MADNIVPILRLLIIMVARDGQVRSRERDYLAWIMDKYEVPQRTRAELLGELKHPPRLEDVWPRIKTDRDRKMAVDLLRVVMGIDGKAAASERAFFAEVLALAGAPTLGDSVVEHADNIMMWKDLAALGKKLRRHSPWWRRFF